MIMIITMEIYDKKIIGLSPIPLFTPRSSDFGLIQTVHSISTLTISHHK